MDDRYRFFSMVVVWVAYAAVMLGLFALLADAGMTMDFMGAAMIFAFVMFLTSVAAYATRVIWRSAASPAQREQITQDAATKAKRDVTARVQRLIDGLDEDEIVELENLLVPREDDSYYARGPQN